MIIFLGILLLSLSFVQSIIGLKGNVSKDNSSNKSARNLSILFFIILVIGIVSLVFNESDKDKINDIINQSSNKLDTLNQSLENKFERLNINYDKTVKIINNIDSLTNLIDTIMTNEKKLINQYKSVNSKLKSQLYLEQLQLKEREAIVYFDSEYTHWDTTSKSICKLDVCVSNIGTRVATIEKGKGYVLLIDKNNKINMSMNLGGVTTEDKLQSITNGNLSYCYFSEGVFGDYNHMCDITNFGIIMLEVKYRDELSNKSKISKTYAFWSPELGFGRPKQWQKNIALKWEQNNYQF